jgi:hypothetical protein
MFSEVEKELRDLIILNFPIEGRDNINSDAIEVLVDDIDWHQLSASLFRFSDNFIREFSDKLDWYYLSRYHKLSENIIREFKDKVVWEQIPMKCGESTSDDFIWEMKDEIGEELFKQYVDLGYISKKYVERHRPVVTRYEIMDFSDEI